MNELLKTRRLIFRELKRIGIKPASGTFSSGMVLLAIFVLGTVDVDRVRALSGQSDGLIDRVVRRCRKAGIIRGFAIRANWDNEQYGGFSVLLDAMVAAGVITRGSDPKASKANKDTRAQRRVSGKCTNCGRDRDDENAVCLKCRASMKQSAAKRKAASADLEHYRSITPWYIANQYAPKRTNTRLGRAEEFDAAQD